MADKEERSLQNAVKNARSAFYAFKGKKRKETRKEARRAARLSKKSRKHSQHTKCAKNVTAPDEAQLQVVHKKNKKRKRKKKIVDEDNQSYDKAAYNAANKIDEKIIASLGKKLGGKGKKDKLASIFKQDGLDYILEVCEPFTADDAKGFSSDEEYLASKSKKVKRKSVGKEPGDIELSTKAISNKLLFEDTLKQGDEDVSDDDNDVNDDNDDDHDPGDGDDDDGGGSGGDDDDGSYGDLEDEECEIDETDESCNEFNENDNGATDNRHDNDDDDDDNDGDDGNNEEDDGAHQYPEDKEIAKGNKYIPPALRNRCTNTNDKQELKELQIKKKLKGLLNRASDGTLKSIVSEIETMYLDNSKNFMNAVLYKMIYEACISSIATPEKLVLQHMVIITALHVTIGSEIGAYFLQMLSERFSSLHNESPLYGEGKTCHNILLMFVTLYNLKVVDSVLIYDLLQACLANFREQDIELIFLILKSCGPDLRKDDPGALKDVIVTVHAKAAQYQCEDKSYVNFMLQTIDALKNNNMRKIPLYDSAIVEDARKCLKTIVQGKNKMSSGMKLKVSLEDMLNAKEKGRWWITGSAWSGHGPVENKTSDVVSDEMSFSTAVLEAAKKQRMNTTVRKQIFCVLVSSEDYLDAFERLLKLNLTEKQFREVVHVLVDCCLQEKTYNPFYTHLGDRLCEFNRSNQVTFQYNLWDRFKTLSTMKKHSRSNLEQFLAHMIASKSLSLSVLKIISFAALDKDGIDFFSSFFTRFLLQYPQNTIKSAFQRIANLPKLSLFRQGIKLFLRQYLYPERTKENFNNEKMKEILDIVESAIDGCDYVPL